MLLKKIRERLEDEIESDYDRDVDEKELQRFLTDDEYIRRYIRRMKGDVKKSTEFLLSVLEWRKSYGINKLTESSFPKEFWDLHGVEILPGTDRQNCVVLNFRIALYERHPDLIDLFKKFMVYQMLKADAEGAKDGKNGWLILFDCCNIGVANVDLDMVAFIANTLKLYFPMGQKYILIHNLPWYLTYVKDFALKMLPATVQKVLKFSDSKTITDYISPENLPKHLSVSKSSSDGEDEMNDNVISKRQVNHGKSPPVFNCDLMTTDEMVSKGLIKLSGSTNMSHVSKFYEKLFSRIDGTGAWDHQLIPIMNG